MALTEAQLKTLREQLLAHINPDDLQQLEKVERYLSLLELDAKLVSDIKKEGTQITVENGAQRFVKTHPAIGERMKLNSQLLSLEKSMGLDYQSKEKEREKAQPAPAPAKANEGAKPSNVKPLRPTAADLL